jgi:hypothetical protein
MRGDGSTIMRLAEIMTAKVGSASVEAMRAIAMPPHEEWTLEMLEELRDRYLNPIPAQRGNGNRRGENA